MAQSEVELVKSVISPDGATVDCLPDLVAIFGGPLSTSSEIAGGLSSKSCRDAYIQWLAAHVPDDRSKTLMPESFEDWNNFNTYSDLLLFEADLGYLTAAIVVFLEAPGSIAELGAFSQIESLKDRLVIVVTGDRHPIRSFISLGPLRQLEKKDRDSVCVVPAKDQTEILNDISVINAAVLKKKASNRSLSEILCARHNMSTRSMNAKQDKERHCGGQRNTTSNPSRVAGPTGDRPHDSRSSPGIV